MDFTALDEATARLEAAEEALVQADAEGDSEALERLLAAVEEAQLAVEDANAALQPVAEPLPPEEPLPPIEPGEPGPGFIPPTGSSAFGLLQTQVEENTAAIKKIDQKLERIESQLAAFLRRVDTPERPAR